ncbi:MAG: chain length-determining protein [Betaproteobacteria bacterium]|nr:chain length-determining protein [Betaproteobacteria bacterium]
MHQLVEQLLSYPKATWQYRWHAAAAAWVVAVAGWIAVALLPDRYEALARVHVDTQSILRPLLAGLAMQPNDNQIVEMMGRTLISRPNVERVIKMAEIDAKLKTAADYERMVTRLTKELVVKGGGAQRLFTITFTDRDPEQAKRVVQALLSIFVEGSQVDKRKDSESARSFIDEQLKAYAERLTAAENAVTAFKRRNVGLMPGEGQNFYTRLSEARAALSQARLELTEAEQGRDAIRKRLAAEASPSLADERRVPDVVTPRVGTPRVAIPEAATPEIDARILALQQRLDGLRLTYTERHPDIVGVLASMDQLKEQKRHEMEQKQREIAQKQRELDQAQRELERTQREANERRPSPAAATPRQDLVYQQLSISLAEFEASVASLRARVTEYERRLGELRAATNAAPQVEAEFTQLTRDYEVTKQNYDQLATRREAAQLTGDMQSNTDVVGFRVIDPPRVSATPDWPNRPLFKSLALLIALAGGVGLAFLISRLRPTINTERSLRELSGLAVYGTVILTRTEAQSRKYRVELSALVVCMLALLSVYAAVMIAPIVHRFTNSPTLFPFS